MSDLRKSLVSSVLQSWADLASIGTHLAFTQGREPEV